MAGELHLDEKSRHWGAAVRGTNALRCDEQSVVRPCRTFGAWGRLAFHAAVVCVLLLGFLGVSGAASLKIGDQAPRISLVDRQGKPVSIPDDLLGKVVVIHFWADTCPYCLEEMPALERIFDEYKSDGLVIVAVNVGQSAERVTAYVEKMKVTYPVLLDQELKAAKSYRVRALPRTFMVDRKGHVRYKILGDASEETLRKLIQKLM